MSDGPRPMHPLAAVGLALVAAGVLVWIWTGDWRWAATGAVLLLVLAPVGAALDRKATK